MRLPHRTYIKLLNKMKALNKLLKISQKGNLKALQTTFEID